MAHATQHTGYMRSLSPLPVAVPKLKHSVDLAPPGHVQI